MWQSDDEWARELTKQVSAIDDRPNLARVVGYCATRYKKKGHVEPVRFIVEEDACNGNLHDYLHKGRHQPLSWAKRLSILRDVARGLAYFHDELDNKVHTYKHIYHSFTNKIFLLHLVDWCLITWLFSWMLQILSFKSSNILLDQLDGNLNAKLSGYSMATLGSFDDHLMVCRHSS